LHLCNQARSIPKLINYHLEDLETF
jgi:hypothetical protein